MPSPNQDRIEDLVNEHKREELLLKSIMGRIKHKVIVMSGKGGVGKSTVAVNLAVGLAARGRKVGILDVDITGPDVPLLLGLEGKRLMGSENGMVPVEGPLGIKVVSMAFVLQDPSRPIVWRGPMKMGAIRQFLSDVDWGDLDFLVIDLPPGTGDEPLSVVQYLPGADGAVIVTTPQDVALLDVSKAVSFAQLLNLNVIGIIENMSGLECPHCNKEIEVFKKGGGERLAKDMGVPFLGRVPLAPVIMTASDAGTPFIGAQEDSPAKKAFSDIIDKIEGVLKGNEEKDKGRGKEKVEEKRPQKEKAGGTGAKGAKGKRA